ncbi:hypothetical protein HK103_007501 [Boothiomyces macroporosus]|uniref:Major facilitator superfamily (MFS) profile domain-containing protein n=1 Tax=Boothiomyces macroporosus TaxID=261099 RepID=A0AAD5Y5X3_9FUNG|nr:hypothetical protein HK103_007501 [Boothiomyces macroporosus]
MSQYSKTFIAVICGAALLSDGYVNNSISVVISLLKKQYPEAAANNQELFSSIVPFTYLGTIIGMLTFGWIADKYGRKAGMISANLLLIFFTLCCAASFEIGGTADSLFWMLLVFRTFLGIGIGAEYPTGSVAAAESTGEEDSGGHSLFVLVTDLAINIGFILSQFTAFLLALIFQTSVNGLPNYDAIWRTLIALGVAIPIIIFFYRVQLAEPKAYAENCLKKKVPISLVLKKYWFRLAGCGLIWMIYNLVAFPFGNFISIITDNIYGYGSSSLSTNYWWDTVTLLFYIPGSLASAFFVKRIGPKKTLMLGLFLQAVTAVILYIGWNSIQPSVVWFSVVYGCFLAFGELGPGGCIGLIAANSCPSAVRGQFYGVAAALGKVGAFIGTKYFFLLQKQFGPSTSVDYNRGPFIVAAALNLFAIILVFIFVGVIGEDAVERDNADFREYLIDNGYDSSVFGIESSPKSLEDDKINK